MSAEDQLQNVEQQTKPKMPKLTAEKALPASGADVLVKIIKGYVVTSNAGESPVKYSDVASATGLGQSTVSANNNFLAESQILTSPKYGYYLPSEEAIRFAREAAWDEEKAKSYLRRLISRCWYGQVAIQNFALRPALTRLDMKKSLAIKAGATEGDSNVLERLIDFIVYTGLVLEDDHGTLTKGNLDEVEASPSPNQLVEKSATIQSAPKVYAQEERKPTVSVVMHVHLKDWNELTPENAARLREWLLQVGLPHAEVMTQGETPPAFG